MSFYTRKRRTPVIPIVPLIDILTVLLIFFVVTTTFKKKQNKNTLLKIALPEATQLQPLVETTPRTPISVTEKSEIFLADRPVTVETLGEAITAFRSEQPGATFELKADQNAPLGTLVKIWDALAAAGLRMNTDVPTKILVPQK